MRLSKLSGLLTKASAPSVPPTYVGTGKYISRINYNTTALPFPSGYQEGDLLIVVYYGPVSFPSGWTAFNTYIRYKIATASESNVNVYGTSSQAGIAQMIAFRGVNQTDPINASGSAAVTRYLSAPNVYTTVDNCMMFAAVVFIDGGTSLDTSNYSSWANSSWESVTERMDVYAFSPGYTLKGIASVSGVKATAGLTGTLTATADSSTNSGNCTTLAIAPA